jgi:phosphatidylinositol alpha-1,6-mannosyltransferase
LIHAHLPDVHYLLAGLPTRQPELSQLATELGVSEYVHFLGRVDNQTLVEAYNACNVYIMTSRYTRDGDFEGYGIAVIEAALCGKPAVVSCASGLEEAVVAEQTGLLVPPDDPHLTAQALIRLLQDDPLRSKLGLQARQHALQSQTWTGRVAEYADLLRNIQQRNLCAS